MSAHATDDATGSSDLNAGTFDPFGRDPVVWARLAPLFDRLLSQLFRLQIEGIEHIPQQGRALLVCNHGGALPWDALVLTAAVGRATGRPVRPLIEDAVMTAPFLGTFMNRVGCVRASQDNAVRLLQREELTAVFPEGMLGLAKLYRHRNKLQRFGRGGFVRLALRTTTPLLPVAIVGAEDTAPLLAKLEVFFRGNDLLPYLPLTPLFPWLGPLGLLPLPAQWRIRIGPPMVLGEGDNETDASDVRINTLTAQVRERIQADVDDLVRLRGPAVYRGAPPAAAE